MNKNTLFYSGAVGVAQIFSFLTLFAYTKNLKPELYAYIAIFETIIMLLQSCIGGAIDRGAQRYLVDLAADKVISSAVWICTALSIVLFPVVWTGFTLFSQYTSLEISMMYIAAFGYILHSIILVKYQFSERPKLYFYASISKTLSFFVFSLVFIYLFNLEEKSFLYSSVITGLLLVFITILVVKPKLLYVKDFVFIKDILTYSLPFVPTLLASWCIIWSSRIFMTGHIDAHEIGIFSAAQRVAMVFFIFTQAVTLVATPMLFRLLNDCRKKDVCDYMLLNIKVLMIIALCISFFLPSVLSIVMGEDYEGIRCYISLLMYVNFLSAVMGISTSILFNFYKQTALQMKVFLIVSFFAFFLNALLIPAFNMLGVFLSLLIPMVFLLIIHFYYVNKIVNLPGFNRSVLVTSLVFTLILLSDYTLMHVVFKTESNFIYQITVVLTCLFFVFRHKINAFINSK